jgi:WD40 repeat protein
LDAYKNLLASGGEDDKAYVWTYESIIDTHKQYSLLFECEKMSDSVTNVKFSFDGKYLAVGDMAGNLSVYSVESKSKVWSYEIGNDVELIEWHPMAHVLFSSTCDGNFLMFKVPSESSEVKVMYAGDNAALSCFSLLKDGKRAVCCYNNGNVRIWDLKTTQAAFNISKAHQGDILTVDINSDGHLAASGGVDLKIVVINTTNGKILCQFKCDSESITEANKENNKSRDNEEVENSIESIAFCKTMPLLAGCTVNGEIYVWDLNTQSLRSRLSNDSGFSKLSWGKAETLFLSSLDGSMQIYDGRNLQLLKKLQGHVAEVFDFRLCHELKLIVTASGDNTLKTFEYSYAT